MLDIRLIREQPELVKAASAAKNVEAPVDRILALDEERRALITEVEAKKAERNEGSKQVGKAKDAEERQAGIIAMRELGDRITAMDERVRALDAMLRELILGIPNIPDAVVPVGADERANDVIEEMGEKPEFSFQPKPHWELAESLGIIDFERGVKVAGSRFHVLRGDGARLQRALTAWMLDVHTRHHGYGEVDPPLMVLAESLVGTGNLPKFADALFRVEDDDKWLIPTSEVPITNLYRDEILEEALLPIYHTAATPCFRREQISGGRDVRGIKRVYQFEKVEMVKFTHPERSEEEHQRLLDEALTIVKALELPYRVLRLSTGDMTFASAHTYDIEVYAAGSDEWLEVSSCSNFRDYQARRANLRFRPDGGGRPQFLHTLNGSGLALPRTMIAILENNQREDGTVAVPPVLRPHLGGLEAIEKQPPLGPARHHGDGV